MFIPKERDGITSEESIAIFFRYTVLMKLIWVDILSIITMKYPNNTGHPVVASAPET